MRSTLWPEARVAELKQLLSQPGMTYDKAAAMFGTSRNGIASILRRTRRADYVPRKSPSKAAAKIVSKPVPKASVEAPVSICMGMMQLTSQSCRWPSDNTPLTFCGHQKDDGSPYCLYHRQRSRVGTPTDRERQAAIIAQANSGAMKIFG